MSSGVPYSTSSGEPITEDAISIATAQFSEGMISNAFEPTQPPWTYTAPSFKASIGASPKKNLSVFGLIDFLKGVRSESPKTYSRVTSSNAVVFPKTDLAECYETLEMHNAAGSPDTVRHYMSKAVWRRQESGQWLITEYTTVQGREGIYSSSTASTSGGLSTPPETPKGATPAHTSIADTLKAMTAQYSIAINSRLFDISQPPWSYIKSDVFRATMPPAEHHKMTLEEMVTLLKAITAHSTSARSTIIDSSVTVRENIGWAEVWQNLELRDTARSKDVVHHYMERMIWERQEDDGRWLAIEYSNMQGLDRAGLPR